MLGDVLPAIAVARIGIELMPQYLAKKVGNSPLFTPDDLEIVTEIAGESP